MFRTTAGIRSAAHRAAISQQRQALERMPFSVLLYRLRKESSVPDSDRGKAQKCIEQQEERRAERRGHLVTTIELQGPLYRGTEAASISEELDRVKNRFGKDSPLAYADCGDQFDEENPRPEWLVYRNTRLSEREQEENSSFGIPVRSCRRGYTGRLRLSHLAFPDWSEPFENDYHLRGAGPARETAFSFEAPVEVTGLEGVPVKTEGYTGSLSTSAFPDCRSYFNYHCNPREQPTFSSPEPPTLPDRRGLATPFTLHNPRGKLPPLPPPTFESKELFNSRHLGQNPFPPFTSGRPLGYRCPSPNLVEYPIPYHLQKWKKTPHPDPTESAEKHRHPQESFLSVGIGPDTFDEWLEKRTAEEDVEFEDICTSVDTPTTTSPKTVAAEIGWPSSLDSLTALALKGCDEYSEKLALWKKTQEKEIIHNEEEKEEQIKPERVSPEREYTRAVSISSGNPSATTSNLQKIAEASHGAWYEWSDSKVSKDLDSATLSSANKEIDKDTGRSGDLDITTPFPPSPQSTADPISPTPSGPNFPTNPEETHPEEPHPTLKLKPWSTWGLPWNHPSVVREQYKRQALKKLRSEGDIPILESELQDIETEVKKLGQEISLAWFETGRSKPPGHSKRPDFSKNRLEGGIPSLEKELQGVEPVAKNLNGEIQLAWFIHGFWF